MHEVTMTLHRPPAPARPWWHLRPTERRPLAWILGVGGPAGFAIGALLGTMLQTPGPPLPAVGQGMPGITVTSVAPPNATVNLSPTRPQGTGSALPTRRVSTRDATRLVVVSPPRRVDTPTPATTVRNTPAETPTVTTTVRAAPVNATTVTTTRHAAPVTTSTTPPTSSTTPTPTSTTETDTETEDPGPAPGEGPLDQARDAPGGSGREPTPYPAGLGAPLPAGSG
jgi:hypothetical protein